MRIRTIQLNNFRQFYGKTPLIEFSHGDLNTTIIHASNGGGKTALLNSLTWTFYEEFSSGFLSPNELVNKRAIYEAEAGERVEASVEICFDHESIQYQVKRSCRATKLVNGEVEHSNESELIMQSSSRDGNWRPVPNPEQVVSRILPKALHSYFFFDGERIEKIVNPDKKATERLGEATKMLLGVETLIRAEKHLNDVKKDFETELKNIGEAGTKDLLIEKKRLEQECETLDIRLEELGHNIEGDETRKKKISDELRNLGEAKNLQKRRDSLLEEQDRRKDSQQRNDESQKKLISKDAYSLFIGGAVEAFTTLLERLEQKGELPAGIKMNFVDDLLDKGQCICGSSLKDHSSEEFASVSAWKAKAGLADVESKAIQMRGEIRTVDQKTKFFWEQMKDIQIKQDSDREELSRIENELDEISSKLKGSSHERIAELENQLSKVSDSIREGIREQALKEQEKEVAVLKIREIDENVRKQEQKGSRQKLLQRRIQATADSSELVRKLRELMEKEMRLSLSERIKRLFSKISVTPYIPELNDQYQLKLTERSGGRASTVAASQGENQVLSFSFIGAIVEEAKAWVKEKSVIPGPRGCEYPIIMDSPFGALDETNRRNIAEHLNILADQVVLLLTKTQWRGEVQQAVSKKVGKQYVVCYQSSKDQVDHEKIEIDGEDYWLVRQSPDKFEYSTIEGV